MHVLGSFDIRACWRWEHGDFFRHCLGLFDESIVIASLGLRGYWICARNADIFDCSGLVLSVSAIPIALCYLSVVWMCAEHMLAAASSSFIPSFQMSLIVVLCGWAVSWMSTGHGLLELRLGLVDDFDRAVLSRCSLDDR